MKVHYINILLFALPLNILVTLCHEHNERDHNNTTLHTSITRSLCECELYAPTNYDNDPEMKAVMQDFDRQTSQRFEEYNEHMKDKRKKCKAKCDKDIQKIILKDKMEKQMAEKLTTLETKINTDDIPTCICEKTMADKTEKFCLNCGVNVGGGVTLSSGVLGGIGAVAVNAWKDAALEAAIDFATKAGAAAGEAAGMKAGKIAVIESLKKFYVHHFWPAMPNYILEMSHYNDVVKLTAVIHPKKVEVCQATIDDSIEAMCTKFDIKFDITQADGTTYRFLPGQTVPKVLEEVAAEAELTAKAAEAAESAKVTAEITARETALIEAGFNSSITSINASIIAIVVIVLIMVIIYLILRYRRKNKMKRKLQYIKLLEE
ncbi:variant surface antigen rifin [Plasmodium falciparum IGH-CR14]|uniref:Variant surface antigen rifin n=1 Tax=Plasmodium falciparum IGH-CR14 TaxID=580059 RepID=A0A0L1ID85_PLAFA|nr:variant surface antigen rifin [Plasmodium falciparum IGH-CR14]